MLGGIVLYQKTLLSGKAYLEVLSESGERIKAITSPPKKGGRELLGKFVTCEYKRKSARGLQFVCVLQVCEKHSFLPLLENPLLLLVWKSSLDLCRLALEEEVCREIFGHLEGVRSVLLGGGGEQLWKSAYIALELCVLRTLGFGMHIHSCKVTQATTELAFISPNTGAAVVRAVGEPYKKRLLLYPEAFTHMLKDSACVLTNRDFFDALKVIGFFLQKHTRRPLMREQIFMWAS